MKSKPYTYFTQSTEKMNQGTVLVIVTSLEVIAVVYGFFGLMQWAANHEHQAKVQQE